MSLAKLTSLSTQTLSLLLERQRLQSLSPLGAQPTTTNLHLPQISRNLKQLRKAILDMEEKDGRSEAVVLLKSQFGRMRGMLGEDAEVMGIEAFQEDGKAVGSSGQPGSEASGSRPNSGASTPSEGTRNRKLSEEPIYTPYTDDPEAGLDPALMLQEQRRMMDRKYSFVPLLSSPLLKHVAWYADQDLHLENLSRSVNRQRDISIQINDELDVHTGLLQELDHDLDRTESRLGGARRQLERVAKGARNNGTSSSHQVSVASPFQD